MVSVADAGETAVVVSMVEGHQAPEQHKPPGSEVEVGCDADKETDASLISVADDGETAVVVSMVKGHQKSEQQKPPHSEVELGCDADKETVTVLSETDSGDANFSLQPENSGHRERTENCLIADNHKGFGAKNDNKSEILLETLDLKGENVALPCLEDTPSELCARQSHEGMLQASLTEVPAEGVIFSSCYVSNLNNDEADEIILESSASGGDRVPPQLTSDPSETKSRISDHDSLFDVPRSTLSGRLLN